MTTPASAPPAGAATAPPAAPSPAAPSPSAAPAGAPSTPADIGLDPPAAAAAPAADPPPAGDPPPVDHVAEVMKQRDASRLATLIREKREAEAAKARLTENAPILDGAARARQFAEVGDHDKALEAALTLVYGDKVKEVLPQIYANLTSRVLGQESPAQQTARLTHDIAHLQRQLDELNTSWTTQKAAYEEWKATDDEQRIAGGVKALGELLEKSTEYPHLLAEADDPGQIVWDIMVSAIQRGEEPPEPEVAAKMADDYFRKVVEKKKPRYQTLLNPQGTNGSPKPGSQTSTIQGRRTSLTNADAASPPDLKPPEAKPMTREESIEHAHRVLVEGTRRNSQT